MPPATIHQRMCRALFHHIIYTLMEGAVDRWVCQKHPRQEVNALGFCVLCYPSQDAPAPKMPPASAGG